MTVKSLLLVVAACTSSSPAANPKYLLFESYTFLPPDPPRPQVTATILPHYTGSPTDAAAINAYAISKDNIALQVDDLLASVPDRGDHVTTQLGFVVGPLALDLADEQLRAVIDNAFDVAIEKDVAVGIHIDDQMFWSSRTELTADPQNTEWSDWNGTAIPHRIIDWVGTDVTLAPPMCVTSPALLAEASRISRDVIGAEIAKNLDHLAELGKSHLFAGVFSVWEPHVTGDPSGPSGFCALHHLGYSAAQPPASFDHAVMYEALIPWVERWGQGLRDAGLPRDRVYTHVALLGSEDYADAAFGGATTPGFSIYTLRGFTDWYNALAARGNPAWGISEGSPGDPTGGPVTGTMEQYLARAFNHGARYVNLFQWVVAAHDPVLSSPAALAAYDAFLRGAPLAE